jgi:hypothetical protein
MSTHLLSAWNLEVRALHTAADDLESFLWVLVWSLVCIFKVVTPITNRNAIILRLESAFSSHTFMGIKLRDDIARFHWKDKVFRGLIEDWLGIAQASRDVIGKQEEMLLSSRDDENKTLDELDNHCEEVYEKFIRTGYEHLDTLRRRFSSWREVTECNGNSLNM